MELNGAKILYTIHTNIPVLGDFKITQTLVSTWIVMALLSALAFWLGRDLKLENVSKRQAAAEFIVERLDQFVHDNMGWHFDQFIPLVGAIFALSIGCNLISVVGLWSPTADLNTEAEAMKAEYEQNLQNARTEANQIVAAAQKTAAARSEELLGEARAQAAALKQKAEADIAQERKKAVNEVKDEIGGMAMEIASKVVEREIKEADHQDLIDEFIKNVGEAS